MSSDDIGATHDDDGANKMMVGVAALAAGLVAQKGFEMAWRVIRGSDPKDDSEDSPLLEVLVFAAASAAVMAVARSLVTHEVRQFKARKQAL